MRKLIEEESQPEGAVKPRRGPPNRMNDLSYKDWMKFQKSFFWYSSAEALAEECTQFFTKAVWPQGNRSRSLIIGVEGFHYSNMWDERIVDSYNEFECLNDVIGKLSDLASSDQLYDFGFFDLRRFIRDRDDLSKFLTDHSDLLFESIRRVLVPQRYCAVLVETEETGGSGFPIPWAVALSCREHLRLRDEKVGLVRDRERVLHCLFMQAIEDSRPKHIMLPDGLGSTGSAYHIPAWIIPKPPPRKRNEKLHPAKFPETLVSEFIELFTNPGDTVFDPMAGTGSTIIAAHRAKRHAYGLELIPEWVEIAKNRIDEATTPSLFDKDHTDLVVLQGDATCLNDIDELHGKTFDYAITSPPYWSMLSNQGSENQEARRKKNLALVYSDDKRDLGNVLDYDEFLDILVRTYNQLADWLVDNGHLTIVVKNVKREHILYPLAWDLMAQLCAKGSRYDYVGTTLWCQDDVGLKPFAVGIHWVSNILHHHCLHFRKRA